MKVYTGLNASDIILSFNNLPATYNQSVYTTFGTVYINQSDLNKAFTNSYNAGQTFTFASIVIMQIVGNLMSTRTHLRSSLFQQVQWKKTTRNLYVHGAQLISCFLMIIAVYVTLFNTVFQSAPFDVYLLGLPLAFAILIVFLDELRKLLARRNLLYFHKFGW
jgi:magnesium-transporting ATPase (P-type)